MKLPNKKQADMVLPYVGKAGQGNGSCTRLRMDTIPNGQHSEWTHSRICMKPNRHDLERTPAFI